MDVNRLSEVLSWLRSEENTHKFQAKITSVRDTLQNLANSPGDQSSQVNLANALQELASAFTAFQADYDPS